LVRGTGLEGDFGIPRIIRGVLALDNRKIMIFGGVDEEAKEGREGYMVEILNLDRVQIAYFGDLVLPDRFGTGQIVREEERYYIIGRENMHVFDAKEMIWRVKEDYVSCHIQNLNR